jgi:hypothetical protein
MKVMKQERSVKSHPINFSEARSVAVEIHKSCGIATMDGTERM